MKKMLILTIWIIILITGQAFANNYYVDNTHATASNSNPGTESSPWKTIQHAADTVSAGDTIFVKPGEYNERITINRAAGEEGNKITLKSLPRRSATILHGFHINKDYIRIEGFRITHDKGGWNGGGIWLAAHNVDIVDNYIYEVPGQGISPSWGGSNNGLWDNIYVAYNHMYKCNKGLIASGNHWLVENNEVERLVYADEDADYMRFFGKDIIIRHNFFHGTLESEVGNSHTDGFQTFSNANYFAEDILIEYNYVGGFFHQGVISASGHELKNITVQYNIFDSPTSWGILTTGTQNIVVKNNTFFNVAIHGIGFRGDANGIVKNNIITGANASYWAETENGASYDNGYNIIFECGRDPNPGSSTDLIDENPLFVNSSNILGPDGLPFTADDGLRVEPGSKAINGGENGSYIGAYEYTGSTTPQIPTELKLLKRN